MARTRWPGRPGIHRRSLSATGAFADCGQPLSRNLIWRACRKTRLESLRGDDIRTRKPAAYCRLGNFQGRGSTRDGGRSGEIEGHGSQVVRERPGRNVSGRAMAAGTPGGAVWPAGSAVRRGGDVDNRRAHGRLDRCRVDSRKASERRGFRRTPLSDGSEFTGQILQRDQGIHARTTPHDHGGTRHPQEHGRGPHQERDDLCIAQKLLRFAR